MEKDKVSIIITAFKEPKTIGKAITRLAKQKIANEIIIVAPDEETLLEAKKLKRNCFVKRSWRWKTSSFKLSC